MVGWLNRRSGLRNRHNHQHHCPCHHHLGRRCHRSVDGSSELNILEATKENRGK